MDLRFLFFLVVLAYVQCKLVNLPCPLIIKITNAVNEKRLKTTKGETEGQPGAANMKLLVWDDELAAKAAEWASHNIFMHNPNRTIPSGRFTTGECIYWHATSERRSRLEIEKPIEAWYEEYKHYRFGPMSFSHFDGSRPQVGHYTQMVWADTTHIGCALSVYYDKNWKNFLFVCNFGPAGNYIGQTPYTPVEEGGEYLICTENCNRPYGAHCSPFYGEM